MQPLWRLEHTWSGTPSIDSDRLDPRITADQAVDKKRLSNPLTVTATNSAKATRFSLATWP